MPSRTGTPLFEAAISLIIRKPLRRSRDRTRRGMTLIEVAISLAIFSIVVLSLGGYITRFIRGVADNGVRSTASDLVTDRLEYIKGNGSYATLETTYAGTESLIPGYRAFTRKTEILRVGSPTSTVDYKVITVSVSAPTLKAPAKKTTIISSF